MTDIRSDHSRFRLLTFFLSITGDYCTVSSSSSSRVPGGRPNGRRRPVVDNTADRSLAGCRRSTGYSHTARRAALARRGRVAPAARPFPRFGRSRGRPWPRARSESLFRFRRTACGAERSAHCRTLLACLLRYMSSMPP